MAAPTSAGMSGMSTPSRSSNHSTSFPLSPPDSSTTSFVSFETSEFELLQELSDLIEHLWLDTSKCPRGAKGSPACKKLTTFVQPSKQELKRIKERVNPLLENSSSYGAVLKGAFENFTRSLENKIDESVNGHAERVVYLEKLVYHAGQLKGMVDLLLQINKPVLTTLQYDEAEEEEDYSQNIR